MSTTDPTDRLARLEQRHEYVAAMLHEADVTTAPDGIGALGLPHRLAYVLIDADLLAIAQVQRCVADDTITGVKGIGASRKRVLRDALARWGQEHSADRALAYRDDDEFGYGGEC